VGGASNAVRFFSKKSHLPRCVGRGFWAKSRVAAETVDIREKNYQTSVTSISYYRFYEQVRWRARSAAVGMTVNRGGVRDIPLFPSISCSGRPLVFTALHVQFCAAEVSI